MGCVCFSSPPLEAPGGRGGEGVGVGGLARRRGERGERERVPAGWRSGRGRGRRARLGRGGTGARESRRDAARLLACLRAEPRGIGSES